MKPLSETYKELGIAFKLPLVIKDANGNETYCEYSDGYWRRHEYDANGNETYCKNSHNYSYRCQYDDNDNRNYFEDSNGLREGTPRSAKTCEGKVVEVDGIKYKLKAL
jgi:hypothetical protein